MIQWSSAKKENNSIHETLLRRTEKIQRTPTNQIQRNNRLKVLSNWKTLNYKTNTESNYQRSTMTESGSLDRRIDFLEERIEDYFLNGSRKHEQVVKFCKIPGFFGGIFLKNRLLNDLRFY